MGVVVLSETRITGTAAQRDALMVAAKRLGLSEGDVRWRINRAVQDAASREIARLTTPGPESNQGWQQRCNACREARALECASCGSAECGGNGDDAQDAQDVRDGQDA